MRLVLLLVSLVLVGCHKLMPDAPAEDQLLDGPVDGLSTDEQARFLAGDVAFNDEVFTSATGLGPLFVSTSCGSCHAGDGRGHPFTSLTRFGQNDGTGNQYLDQGGPQLQHRALPGFAPEEVPAGATSTRLLPPPNTGLGFLDAVPDAMILALADPDDLDGDGISGTPNWITTPAYITHRPAPVEQGGKHIGRFGRKGAAYDLLQQTANAYNQDIGITSNYEPVDTYTGAILDPEVSNSTVDQVVFYLLTLKAPIQRDKDDPQVIAGEQVFTAVGCAKCHTPELVTGPSPIAPLANKTVRPYSDLLLHDMGSGLDDGYTEGSALTSEWRTPPLWGLGLSSDSQGGSYFLLHDGRATTIEQAIEAHDGEGQASRIAYQQLSTTDREALLRFLESL
ncbi:MAG: thiol oxidoreductase [Flavobacteriales bacterium]|nr:thiol oxidoreductase [Flavobacteriales bacterium]